MTNELKQIVNRYSQWFKYLELSRIDGYPIFYFNEKYIDKLKYCKHDWIIDFDGQPVAIKIYKDCYSEYTTKKLERLIKNCGIE